MGARLLALALTATLAGCASTPTPTVSASPDPTLRATPGASPTPAPAEARGDLIAYLVPRDLQVEVRLVRADGTGDRRLAGPVGSGVRLAYSCGSALSLEWSPDGSRLAFTSGDSCHSTIHVVNADGTDLRAVAEGVDPAWSPSGDRVVFADDWDPGTCGTCGRTLRTVAVDGGGQEVLVEHPSNQVGQPAWSPDGGSIAYVVYGPAPGPGLHVLDLATGEQDELAAPGERPAWSPDGSMLAYSRFDRTTDGGYLLHLYVRAVAGGAETKIGAGFGPVWSPDGDLVAFVKSRVSWDTGIAVAPPDASFHRELVSDVLGSLGGGPAVDWSADGKQIVFSFLDRDARVETIYVISPEGGEPTPIAEGMLPTWQPGPDG